MKLFRKVLKIWKEDIHFHTMCFGGVIGGLVVIMGQLSKSDGPNIGSFCGLALGLIIVVSVYTVIKLIIIRNDK